MSLFSRIASAYFKFKCLVLINIVISIAILENELNTGNGQIKAKKDLCFIFE